MDTSITMANFGSLRSLLHAPPCGTTWALLCSQLVQFHARSLEEEVIPYLLDHFSRAPGHALHRPLPRAWARMFSRALPSRALLHTINDLTIHEDVADEQTLSDLTRHVLSHIEQIPLMKMAFHGYVGDRATILALLHHQGPQKLTHLTLHHTPYLTTSSQDLIQAIPETLESLHLHQPEVEHASLFAHILSKLPNLERLSIELPTNTSSARELLNLLCDANTSQNLRHRLGELELIGPTRPHAGHALPIHSLDLLSSSTHFFEREWPALERLTLKGWDIPSTLSSAQRSFRIPALQHFALEGATASDESILGLLEAVGDAPLKGLRIAATQATARTLRAILERESLRQSLEHLSLVHNRFTLSDEDHHALFTSQPWESLQRLHLSHVDLVGERVELFEDERGRPVFPHLEKLTLATCRISPEHFYSLSRSELPELNTLLMQGTVFSTKAPDRASNLRRNRQLLSASWLDHLQHLFMPTIPFTTEALDELSRRPLTLLKSLHFDTLQADVIAPRFTDAAWLEHLHLLQPDPPTLSHHTSRIARPYLDLLKI